MLMSGFAIGAMAGRQPTSAAPTPSTPAASAPARAHQRFAGGHGASAGTVFGAGSAVVAAAGAGSGFSAARTTSGVNGGLRKRTPVASKIALAIAAVPGTDDDSPAPSGGSPGRGIIITSTTGTSRKLSSG